MRRHLNITLFDESSLRAVFAKQSLAQIASGFALAMTDHILRGQHQYEQLI
jgi:hypothetical protein